MCTLINHLPKKSKSSTSNNTNANLFMAIKPTKDKKEFYRFRLIGAENKSIGRDHPFIERYVHTKWGLNQNNKPVIESQVVCPHTPYMRSADGKDSLNCPICKMSAMHYKAFVESGKRDRESGKAGNETRRKFEALIPVWVVNDPVWQGNNNKMKVISFADNHRKDYEKLIKLINKETDENNHNVFNGKDAVDLCIRMERVSKVVNEGTPKEQVYSTNEFKMMVFSNKPYTIDAITPEKIEDIESKFDDKYFVKTSQSELTEYYNNYCVASMDDVDLPDDEVSTERPTAKETPPDTTIDELTSDVEETTEKASPAPAPASSAPATPPAKTETPSQKKTQEEEIEAELSSMLDDVEKEVSSTEVADDVAEENPSEEKDDFNLDDFNIDDI